MNPLHRPKIFEASHVIHSHSHSHKFRERRRLALSILLTGSMMVIEVIGGIFSGSLALLSDAGHMFTHFFALLMSLFAILISSKPVNHHKTYGYFRAEVLTALFNGIILIGISFYIFYEAYDRTVRPIPVKSVEMLIIALLGLIVNLVTGILLYEVRGRDINLKSAFAHMVSDTLSSVGVVAGAVVIHYTGWTNIDPLLSTIISLLILFWAGRLIFDSIHILMESTPKHINISELTGAIKNEVKGIKEIHDVHIWEITTHMYAMTAHVTIDECSVSECMKKTERINQLLSERFHIEHINLQYECG
jgi:cobalt-zinc-cadmium efflux system protein